MMRRLWCRIFGHDRDWEDDECYRCGAVRYTEDEVASTIRKAQEQIDAVAAFRRDYAVLYAPVTARACPGGSGVWSTAGVIRES